MWIPGIAPVFAAASMRHPRSLSCPTSPVMDWDRFLDDNELEEVDNTGEGVCDIDK